MSANTETQGSGHRLEIIKWLVVVTLLIVAVVGNYFYHDYKFSLRMLAILLIIIIAGNIAMMTAKGKFAVAFAREARTEVRKVIWPTSKETLHTTLIIAAVTAVMSLILWVLDSIIISIVSFITGLRLF